MRRSLVDLEVVGFVGQLTQADAPVRLLPVFRSRSTGGFLLPPVTEGSDYLEGEEVSPESFQDLLDEGELTALDDVQPAQPGYLLWMDQTGVSYLPQEEAERALEKLCRRAVSEAVRSGLRLARAREQLFCALRACPNNAVVNALLSVHYQLNDERGPLRPLRQDLASQRGVAPSSLEEHLLEGVEHGAISPEVATALAVELRRAGRDLLADKLIQSANLSAPARRAARPSPALGWGLLRQAA